MLKVFKYPLKAMAIQKLMLPTNSKILCVENQYDEPVLYVQVNSHFRGEKPINIIVVGTGQPLPELNLEYIGTVMTFTDSLVWHVYKELL